MENNKRRRNKSNQRLHRALAKVEELEARLSQVNPSGKKLRIQQAVLLRMAGNSNAQVAEAMNIDPGTVSNYMKDWANWCKERPNSHELQTGLLTYVPLAYDSMEHLLEKRHAGATIAYLQGIQALTNKQEIATPQDTSSTPEQFKKLGEYARDNPAIGLILLQAMGIGPQQPSDGPKQEQGILSPGDGGTPGSGTEEDV